MRVMLLWQQGQSQPFESKLVGTPVQAEDKDDGDLSKGREEILSNSKHAGEGRNPLLANQHSIQVSRWRQLFCQCLLKGCAAFWPLYFGAFIGCNRIVSCQL